MKLYFVRHGQSEANYKKIHAGCMDVPLTGQGKADAESAGNLLCGVKFEKVYTSDLIRAIQTADIALPNYEKQRVPLLREISLGELEGRTPADCLEQYGENYLLQKSRRNFGDFGGEDYDMHVKRVREFLEMVAGEEDTNVAVFCHEGTIKCVLDIVLQVGHWISIKNIACNNGSISIFEYKDKHWRLCQWNLT
ncbi:MAG: histidine phosphatase family protein [Tyzzerella sp.]|nr:histidine phosphatase family protein [Tyzzerella sp.]